MGGGGGGGLGSKCEIAPVVRLGNMNKVLASEGGVGDKSKGYCLFRSS